MIGANGVNPEAGGEVTEQRLTSATAGAGSDDEAGAPSAARLTADAILRWSGDRRAAPAGRVAFVDGEEWIEPTRALLAEGDVIVATCHYDPGARADAGIVATPEPGHPLVLRAGGRLSEPGDVLRFGDGYELELQDYLAVAFLPVSRPTVVRFTTEESWTTFLADADEYRASGYLLPQIHHQGVRIADTAVIGGCPHDAAPPQRLSVSNDGTVRLGPDGIVVGALAGETDSSAAPDLSITVSGSAYLRGSSTHLADRPWLSRYLDAIDLASTAVGAPWRVSGFGATLLEHLTPDESRRSRLSLAWRTDEFRLIDASTGRRFDLREHTALAVEALLETGSAEAAAEVLSRESVFTNGAGTGTRSDTTSIETRLDDLLDRFSRHGVDLTARDEACA